MASAIPSVDSVKENAVALFFETFGNRPTVGAFAPGRVNLIGEHTDYNDGFVLPMALPLVTVIVGSKTDTNKCCIITNAPQADEPKRIEFDVLASGKSNLQPGKPAWANYIKGVVANFLGDVCGFNAAIASSVPLGGGIASSAALEVSMYTFLEQLTGSITPRSQDKAFACQKAEHDFPKMPCGIMDQFISVMGNERCVLLIDCRTLIGIEVPLEDPSVVVLITNSNVRHQLTGSEYSSRRHLCEEAAKLIGVKNLRDVSVNQLDGLKQKFEPEMFKRVHHVVTEIQRTCDAADALKQNDYVTFGKLMIDSHNSLRDDFEVSCKELDELVTLALEVKGVFGSRMTGGGFGGCTVTLVKEGSAQEAIKHIKDNYQGNPTFYICTPFKGAGALSVV